MTIKEAIFRYLTGLTAITDLVDNRIYRSAVPAGTLFPYIKFFYIDRNPDINPSDKAVFQFSIFADSGDETEEIYNALFNALQQHGKLTGGAEGVIITRCLVRNSRDLYESDTGKYHKPVEIEINYRR